MGLDNYIVTTPPTTTPVTLPEVKTWLQITACDDDDFLLSLLNAAIAKAEQFTNRVFITRTYTGNFECLMCADGYEKGPYFQVRRAPFGTLTSIKVWEDETQATISSDDYNLKLTSGFSRIIFSELNESPDLIPYPYEVIFTAGYGDADAVPEPIKVAIKEMCAYWYQQRGDCDGGGEIPPVAKGVLGEYRILNTYG